MRYNRWTLALASTGVISLASVVCAEEQPMSQVLTAVSQTTLSGYIDTSAIWKPGTGNDPMPGRAYDGSSKMDGFNLNVVGLTVERPLSDDTWAAGYRADLIFGPDAVGYNAAVNANQDSEFAVKQAYVNLLVPMGNGLELKMGVFNAICGYEVFESYLNPNYGRSYGWQLEPTQHTGLLATYDLSEALSVSGGIANTWVWGVNSRATDSQLRARAESFKAYLASVTLSAPDSWGFLSGSTFSGAVVTGESLGNTTATTTVYAGVNVLTGLEGLSVGGAFDYRFNGPNDVKQGNNWAYAIAGYASFQATDKLAFHGRIDYTSGSDGTFYDGGVAGVVDQQNRLLGLTGTIDYALWANVLSRLELRWDTTCSDDRPFANSDETAFTIAANVIYKF
jgi:hypothetical protein